MTSKKIDPPELADSQAPRLAGLAPNAAEPDSAAEVGARRPSYKPHRRQPLGVGAKAGDDPPALSQPGDGHVHWGLAGPRPAARALKGARRHGKTWLDIKKSVLFQVQLAAHLTAAEVLTWTARLQYEMSTFRLGLLVTAEYWIAMPLPPFKRALRPSDLGRVVSWMLAQPEFIQLSLARHPDWQSQLGADHVLLKPLHTSQTSHRSSQP